jgi:hypothetical protein
MTDYSSDCRSKKRVQFSQNEVSDIRVFEPLLTKEEKRQLSYSRDDYSRFRVERHLELLDRYDRLVKKKQQKERSEMMWTREENVFCQETDNDDDADDDADDDTATDEQNKCGIIPGCHMLTDIRENSLICS